MTQKIFARTKYLQINSLTLMPNLTVINEGKKRVGPVEIELFRSQMRQRFHLIRQVVIKVQDVTSSYEENTEAQDTPDGYQL